MSDGSEEKTDDASDRKLRQLRDKGVLPSSPTGSDFAGFGVGLAVTFLLIPLMIDRLRAAFDRAFANLSSSDASDGFGALEFFLLSTNAPLLGILCAVAVGAVAFKLIAHGGFVFALERVAPKLENVDPINGTKKLFKGEALSNFMAAFVRLLIMIIVLVGLGWYFAPTLLRLDLCAPGCAWPVMWQILRGVLIAVAVLILMSMALDVAVQRAFFLIEQRMTKTEVKRERKEMMGQPEIRQQRRRLSREFSEAGQVVGRNNATMYFYWGDAVVAFAFHPVKVPLPKIAARASGVEQAARLRGQLDAAGIPGKESKAITRASITQNLGDSAKREVFMELATALRAIM